MKNHPDNTNDVPVITNDVLRAQLVPYIKNAVKPDGRKFIAGAK
jgi:hypothetical protein